MDAEGFSTSVVVIALLASTIIPLILGYFYANKTGVSKFLVLINLIPGLGAFLFFILLAFIAWPNQKKA